MSFTFKKADILLPKTDDLTKWSVVACDQYTSQPDYWNGVKENVGTAPSCLNLVFPEIYLKDADFDERIANINSAMKGYIDSGVFKEVNDCFIYVERTVGSGKIRKGIMGVVDLEDYDYAKGSESRIRATEGTVLERIPPRVKIREDAPLELPHVMLLIDDEADSVIGTAAKDAESYEKLYDFDLMCGGGNIKGFKVSDDDSQKIISALEKLADKQGFEKKYGVSGKDVLLFAVGDGNHSLATAKECYTRLKAKLPKEEYLSSPARYALVELVNLHDESLEFEAIHRVVFGVNPKHLMDEMFKYYDCTLGKADGQVIEYVTKSESGDITVKNARANLPVGTLQEFLDKYIAENGGTVDYIHGADVTEKLAKEADERIGFILPAMAKNELFKTVILDGALPRKTFSMGEAFEKRFYLEARKIK